MPYNDKSEISTNNINYLARDFSSLKESLMRYAKSYFPNSYQDFNETSTGMMLLEMNAYVGDVLNFYIDQRYKEMMLPLAEERKNIIHMAKSRGYKVKPIAPAYADLTVTQEVDAVNNAPDYTNSAIIDKGMRIISKTDSKQVFESLDIVDFHASSSAEIAPEVSEIDATTGAPLKYKLTRKVRAVSGETKTANFSIGAPQKFHRLTLAEDNVIEILSVVDSNGNKWYEVEYLSQDKIDKETHYTSDDNRSNAYSNPGNDSVYTLPAPYSLEYIKVSKKFTTEVDENNKTSMVFGNGILRNGQSFETLLLQLKQAGINMPGKQENLNKSLNPLLGDSYGTLGEVPMHLTLTVTYRVGGGIGANVPANDLTIIENITTIASTPSTNVAVTNEKPASGGSSGETLEEIRHRSIGEASTQNRCVTKEDFEIRTLSLPAKFGNIAKVYCTRSGAVRNAQRKKMTDLVGRLKSIIDLSYNVHDRGITPEEKQDRLNQIKILLDADKDGGLNPDDFAMLGEVLEMAYSNVTQDDRLYTVDLYMLSYDNNKNLVTSPNLVKQNLKQYINQFRLLTDQITFFDGYIINFGVVFDVVGQSSDNKGEVKLRCIQKIKDYFSTDKMQFKDIIYSRDLENELMNVSGVRAVNYVTLTQDFDYNSPEISGETNQIFSPPLYSKLINSNGTTSTTTNTGYGHYYDFSKFYGTENVAGQGVVLPAYEPSIFELKNPNQNIRGIVR